MSLSGTLATPSEMLDQRRRWVATASTWARKTTALLLGQAEALGENGRWLVGYDAGKFLGVLLDEALPLVALVPLDDEYAYERMERDAASIAKALRQRRLSQQLENTAGRTPEEAEAFRAAAARLRGEP